MTDLVRYEVRDDVAVVTLNNSPVNALSPGVPEGIVHRLGEANADDAVKAIVLVGGGRTFCAGADIKEFSDMAAGKNKGEFPLLTTVDALEDSAKPVIAAIHGTALGGGLEVAMGCHYRVALRTAKVGLPEVKIGLIPGAMGTQRLPRLCGVAKAAEICVTGRMIKADEALELGVIDQVVDSDLIDAAIAYAREQVSAGVPPRKTSEISDRLGDPAENAAAIEQLEKSIAKSTRGQIAPAKAIEAIKLAQTVPFREAVETEREFFNVLLKSFQSRGLIHAFFGERAVAKIPGITKVTPRIKIEKAAVIGAGTMGGGIAMNYANAGIPVVLKEVDQEQLDKGLEKIRKNYEVTVAKGKLSQKKAEQRMSLITPTINNSQLGDADIIIEAVFEGMELKKKVFTELDSIAKPDAILASNTSTLDIDEIASVTSRPENVIGHHFFSPANVMRLLEVVRGKETSDEVIATSMDLAKQLKKVGVLVGNCFGFVGNRMFGPYMREAQFLVEEGASIEQVDKAMYEFGMAMGPLAVNDLAGIDIGWRIRQETKDSRPEGMREILVADKLYEMGRYGQKTGAGWYTYEGRTPTLDPSVQELIEQTVADAGIQRRDISDEEIVERTVYALVNEGAKILQEGIALRAIDIDIIYVYGYGFPAFRGGPMMHADTVGLKQVCDRVCEFHELEGFWWEPAPLLKELAETGGTFADYQLQTA